jgi:hypothetical protein
MPRAFWISLSFMLITAAGAWIAHRTGIRLLPSVLIFCSAIAATGVFAFLEDKLIFLVDDSGASRRAVVALIAVRISRTFLLLTLGILMFVLLVMHST